MCKSKIMFSMLDVQTKYLARLELIARKYLEQTVKKNKRMHKKAYRIVTRQRSKNKQINTGINRINNLINNQAANIKNSKIPTKPKSKKIKQTPAKSLKKRCRNTTSFERQQKHS